MVPRLSKKYTNIIPTKIQTQSDLQSTLQKKNKSSQNAGGDCINEGGCCCSKKGGQSCDTEDTHVTTTSQEQEKHYQQEIDNVIDTTTPVPELSRKGGRSYDLPEGVSLESCSIFFIGEESLTLTNILMVHNKCQVKQKEIFIIIILSFKCV